MPKAKESSQDLTQDLTHLPSGDPLLLYRQQYKSWEGPVKVISMEVEAVVIQLQRGSRIFRSNCIKPWIKYELYKATDSTPTTIPGDKEDNKGNAMKVDEEEDVDMGDDPRKIQVKKGSKEEKAFSKSRKDELKGLITDGTFVPIHESKMYSSTRIFGSRIVD